MKNKWFKTTVVDQAPLQRGFDITQKTATPGNVPVVSSGGISYYTDNPILSGPGVIIGRKGALGTVFYATGDYWPSDTTLWVTDFKDNNPKFVYYFYKTLSSLMLNLDVGSANPTLNRNHLHGREILWTDRQSQDQIAAFLSALDNKIELNRQMNRTLEQMARALFKSWFIDFDPVHAKQRGEQPAGIDAETAALFPDRLVEIDGKEVPERWAYGSVSDIAQQVKNQMNPSDHPDALFAHFSIPAFDASGRPAIERGSEIKSNKFVVPDAAILVSKLNPATPRIWDTDLSDDVEYRVSSTEFIPLVTRSEDLRAFLYLALTSHDFAKALSGQASGTSNSHQRVKPSDILSSPVLLAPPQVIAAFGRLVIPILDHSKRNLRENNQLAGTRDSLLPRLLSGELDVSDWQDSITEVTPA
ncbi:restriction endonuclease subunit S [Deinococcus knuensis]|nr:restriction endonuclease subunit S [Deinococcus knuensis]